MPYTGKQGRNEEAELTIQRIKGILNSARAEHTSTVSSRIESVQQLKEVVPLTEQLYAVAKETNKLEHENFVLAQVQSVKAELKSVLDSWVRFEQQQREAEQAALIKSVRAGVEQKLADPAFKKQLLEEALTQVEREFCYCHLDRTGKGRHRAREYLYEQADSGRDCQVQGYLSDLLNGRSRAAATRDGSASLASHILVVW